MKMCPELYVLRLSYNTSSFHPVQPLLYVVKSLVMLYSEVVNCMALRYEGERVQAGKSNSSEPVSPHAAMIRMEQTDRVAQLTSAELPMHELQKISNK